MLTLRVGSSPFVHPHPLKDTDPAGLSDLEVVFLDIAMAAGCEAFVPDPTSSIHNVAGMMRGGLPWESARLD